MHGLLTSYEPICFIEISTIQAAETLLYELSVTGASEGPAESSERGEPSVAAAATGFAGTEQPCAAVSVKSTSEVTERKKGPVWPGAYGAGPSCDGSGARCVGVRRCGHLTRCYGQALWPPHVIGVLQVAVTWPSHGLSLIHI
mgnify:CR=1 FL=1